MNDIVLALSIDHMAKLTGLTKRQLAYWDRTGFFSPQHAAGNRRSPHARIYSFADAVGLRTVSLLLNHHGVTLPHLKEVARTLAQRSDRPWSEFRLAVWNRRVQFLEPETGVTRDVVNRQYMLLPIVDVVNEMNEGIEALKQRDQATIGKIEKHRFITHNARVIAGTRVPVMAIREYLEDGYSPAAILKEFPLLLRADIQAVIQDGETGLAA